MIREELGELLHEIVKVNQSIVDTGNYENLISLCEQDIRIIHLLSEHSGISAKEISVIFDAPKTTIVSAVDRLVKRGYILRQSDAADKRRNCLVLTELGEKANFEHIDYENRIIDFLVSRWNESDQEKLAEIISRRNRIS